MDNIIIDNNNILSLDKGVPKRRDLLPRIIKFFCWFFMVSAVLSLVILILSLVTHGTDLSSRSSIFKITFKQGSYIAFTFALLKGFVGWALWTEKKWAVRVAKIDAVLSILLWVYSILVSPILSTGPIALNIRIEILALIPYLIKLINMQSKWESAESYS